MRCAPYTRLHLLVLLLLFFFSSYAFASGERGKPDVSPPVLQQPAPQSPQSVVKTEHAKIPPLGGATVVPLPSTPVDAASAPQQCIDAPSTSAPPEDGQVVNVSITGSHSEVTYGIATPETSAPEPELSTPPDNTTALAAIERNISLFAVRLRERFSIWLERSARYMEIMREILRDKKLPEELVFLPFVESGFNVNAYSTAKAVGPWQFIEATAKRYGLVVDWWRDERRDPVKSTEAAAEYLSDLYSMFGSWHLALAAYNAGEGKIMKALKRTNADDYWSLLRTKQIRDETKEYVPRFFAAKQIAHSPEDFGFSDLDYRDPLEFDEVEIDRPLDIDVIARCSRASVTEIRELNPELRRWSTPPNVDRYTVRIPKGRAELFHDNLTRVPRESCFSYDVYVARKGDTVRKVASKLRVPVTALIALNDYTGFERLDAGDTVKIPPRLKFVMDSDDKASVKKASFSAQAGKQKSSKTVGRSSKRATGKKDKIKARRI